MSILGLNGIGSKIESVNVDPDLAGRLKGKWPEGPAVSAGQPQSTEVVTRFSDLLQNSLGKVNEFQNQADHAVKELVAGRTKNVHETMLALERADMSLRLMMQVRNKLVDAYKEIMRMQV